VFHDIPGPVLDRMRYLEEMSARQKRRGAPDSARLRQVPPETGRFIALLCAGAPKGACIEIGTSGGYSGLWLSLACRASGRKLVTHESSNARIELATETFRAAGVDDIVEIVAGDARGYVGGYRDVGFCFLDAEKSAYDECYDLVVPNLVAGGLLVADNAISHEGVLGPWLEKVFADPRVDALVVPVGSGELVARKI